MKIIAIAAAVVGAFVLLVQPVVAQDLQKGLEALERRDYATALREFKELAEQGHAAAQFNLGKMYHDGRGVTRDSDQAVKWWRLAAEKENADAQFRLGKWHQLGKTAQDGSGPALDYDQAVRLGREVVALGRRAGARLRAEQARH